MSVPLKILILEDRAEDVELLLRQLRSAPFSFTPLLADGERGFVEALKHDPDIILSDFDMPGFGGMRALELLGKSGRSIPFIIISGSIGEDVAVEVMRAGADDYLLKDRMARLHSAINHALEKHRLEREAEQANASLRASEERFRQIAENIQEVFWMTDPVKHELLYVSPAYETIWGRPCADIVRNPSDWLKAIHPDDRARVSSAAGRQLKGTYDEIYRVVRPDGSIRWVRDKAFPIRDEQGNVHRIVGTAEDITEHRKLEEQFIRAQKMEAIGTLAGGIAHDFNNILAAINGYTELAKLQMSGRPDIMSYLNASLQACARATALVRQILAFSRQGAQERKPVRMAQVVQESMDLLRATIPVSIAFETSMADGLPPVLADGTQIHQVMMNLGTNAAHAMKDSAGKFIVKLELRDVRDGFACDIGRLHSGPHVLLSVSDTGCGMSADTMARMFEPFFTTKGPGEGTGLGLAVVHGVMQSHEGGVVVKSTPGVGTTFELYFPVHTEAPQESGAKADEVVPRGKGERILFVDDELPIMMVGQLMLSEIGYRVQASTDAMAMIKLLRENPSGFDLVITDLTMPGISGVDFARQTLSLRSDLPIILTTGYNATLTAECLQKLGISEMLLKPLSMHSLGTAVRRALDGRPVSANT